MKKLALFIFFFVVFSIYSAENRQFQLVDSEYKESFISIEAGTITGLSVISKRMQLSFFYSILLQQGYSLSTDIFLLNKRFDKFILEIGLGSGIIFRPDLAGFESDFYLRAPVKISYNNLFLSAIPMVGTSMFDNFIIGKFNASISIGYKFPIKKFKKSKEDIKEDLVNTEKK